MTDLIKFEFEAKEVRIIQDEKGDPWWVAKDVCDVLEHSNSRVAVEVLEDDEKGVRKVYTLGGHQDMMVISESGLYTLIMRSNKPQAKAFRKWVTSEVLPTIRKTGTYKAPKQKKDPTIALADREFRAALRMAKAFGLDENQAKLSADQAINRMYGIRPMEVLQITHLDSPDTERHLTPTEIGKLLGGLSGQKINKLLESHGLQRRLEDKWLPTEEGKSYTVMKDTGKRKGSGTPVQQMFWRENVLSLVQPMTVQ